MTADNGMDTDAPPIGYERTILNLQRRIRTLEAALNLAVDMLNKTNLIKGKIDNVRTTQRSNE